MAITMNGNQAMRANAQLPKYLHRLARSQFYQSPIVFFQLISMLKIATIALQVGTLTILCFEVLLRLAFLHG
jgi:hypothetical protein